MPHVKPIYRAEQLPVFQNRMFDSAQAARDCTKGDVVLVQSLETGLVFNQAFRPELMVYDHDYQNEQGHSSAFQRHLGDVQAIVDRHLAGRSLIEVGCGKGLFLERLAAAGYGITGLDPTYEGSNPRVIKEYFTPGTGLHAEGLLLRHVLEHVSDPYAFLAGLRESNGGAGLIYIEVPCLDWIAEHGAWFDIFYEHVNYFRLADFARLFSNVLESGRVFSGQYLYVVADLASLRPPRMAPGDEFELPGGFMGAIDASRARLQAQRAAGQGVRAAVWGGASKGVIFSLLMNRAGAGIDTVIDINPAKQGRYLAATGIRVSAPGEVVPHLPSGADIFVMNSNYLGEIQDMTAHKFNYLLVEHERL
jgi:Methyltransferase domain